MVELGSTTVPIMNMLELSAAPLVKHYGRKPNFFFHMDAVDVLFHG